MIHVRNGRRENYDRHTFGNGVTWCGKKLLGEPETEGGVETFTSYGNKVSVTLDPASGTCEHCRTAFDAAYTAAFPEGLQPIATFRTDDPDDMRRAQGLLNPEALSRFFRAGGGGLAAFDEALRDSGRHRNGEDAQAAESEACQSGPKGIAHNQSGEPHS